MDLNSSSCWNSIREKVKSQIPSIDLDFSASENEEIITVYQRPAGFSLKVLEDFNSFSVEDAELEKLLKEEEGTCWSEKTCGSLSLKLDDDEIADSRTEAWWGSGDSDGDAQVQQPLISLKPNVNQRLDQWDLDGVLENLKEKGLSLQQQVSFKPAKIHADGDKQGNQGNIMERLVAYCKSQSSKSVSEPWKSSDLIRLNNSWSKSLERMAETPGHKECPTAHIDLRCPDPSVKPPRKSPNLSSESPAKCNTDQEAPPEWGS